ncbi:acyl-CoA N-acyltransferase [Fusarium oxysporum f. sp. albedinis]|nr:acyl-CoA N-acyltransferase [Fusarium oxysporum f. sp. albedinis]KAJ0137550.1 hypothetical protein HZ326_19464 [Fusarium oxysporum f. sp. albedinis]KAK2469894.1 hypothetical protein H9L39_18709 [Fusarium oxysporum f. sp. albedinis]
MSSTPSSQKSSVVVRPAVLADAASIAELGAHVFSATYSYSIDPEELQVFLQQSYSTTAVVGDLSKASKNILVATRPDGKLAGFAYLDRGSTEPCIADIDCAVELQRIYVHPSAHGTGVGRSLANEAEDLARQQGFQHMWLGVWEENTKAVRVYEHWGYKRVGEHNFAIGSLVQRDFVMLKCLEE